MIIILARFYQMKNNTGIYDGTDLNYTYEFGYLSINNTVATVE